MKENSNTNQKIVTRDTEEFSNLIELACKHELSTPPRGNYRKHLDTVLERVEKMKSKFNTEVIEELLEDYIMNQNEPVRAYLYFAAYYYPTEFEYASEFEEHHWRVLYDIVVYHLQKGNICRGYMLAKYPNVNVNKL